MAFASGLVSFQRFSVGGPWHDDITDDFVKSLAGHSFGQSPVQADDAQAGWIGPGHLFETEILAHRIAFGPFAHLALRVDRLRTPPNVLKAYIHMEEETRLQTSGRDFLSRGEKRQAREAAVIRAEEETRGGSFRRMNSYPVLIDLPGRTVYLANLGASVADKLMELFNRTFGCSLEPVDPEHVAVRIMNAAGNTRALESLSPFSLVEPPEGFGESADFSGSNLNFLGKEFLTWLWHQTDAADGPLRVTSGDDVTVMIDKTVHLKCDFGLTGTDVITADSPASLPEARAALKIGKQPTKAGLIVGCPVGEFRGTLDGERFTVSGLALPEDDTERDWRARLEQRFELVTDAANLIDALFEIFITRRTARKWPADLRTLATWAAGQPPTKTLRMTSA